MADLEALVKKILAMSPDQQFLMVAQLFSYPDKSDLAWAIAKRICDEHEAVQIASRLRR